MVDQFVSLPEPEDTDGHDAEKDQITSIDTEFNVFDRVFITHHSPAVDRRSYMMSNLRDWKFKASFVNYFDAESISPDFEHCEMAPVSQHVYRPGSEYKLKKGEMSLLTKSFYIYYLILKHGLRNTLVLEDDADLKSGVDMALVREAMTMIPPNYSVAQFGSCNHTARKKMGDRYTIYESNGDADHCTNAYAVSRQGAILLFKSLPIQHPIDHLMCGGFGGMHHPDFSSYGVWPSLFAPNPDLATQSTGIRA